MEREIPYHLFEEYLQGVLEGQELEKFELQLKQNDLLKQELELYKSIRTAQNNKPLDEFENALNSAQKEYNQENKTQTNTTKSRTIPLWRWAAIGLLLLGLGYLINSNFSKPTPETLYAEYAKHDFSFQELSSETSLMEIQNSLNNQDYKTALLAIDQYLFNDPNAAEIKLAKGIALLESQQFDAAKTTFQSLATEHPLYKSEVDWYMALTALKQNDINQCLSSLSKIPNTSSRYSDAKKLLNDLK